MNPSPSPFERKRQPLYPCELGEHNVRTKAGRIFRSRTIVRFAAFKLDRRTSEWVSGPFANCPLNAFSSGCDHSASLAATGSGSHAYCRFPMFDLITPFLAQTDTFINWFTPVWILSLGVSAGFLLAMLYVGCVYLMSRIRGVNSIGTDRTGFWVAGGLSSLILIGIVIGIPSWRSGWEATFGEDPISIFFLVPLLALVGFGTWVLASKSRVDELTDLLTEGLLKYLSYFCLALIGFSAVALFFGLFSNWGLIQLVDDPRAILNSLARVPSSGWRVENFEVPPSSSTSTGERIELEFHGAETRQMVFKSNQRVDIAVEPITPNLSSDSIFEIQSTSTEGGVLVNTMGRLPPQPISGLYVFNRGANPAQLEIQWSVTPVYLEVYLIPGIALLVAGFYLAFLCASALAPKISAISLATFKTEIGQPLFLLILLIGAVFIVLSIYVPYNTFGEDIKMYKDSGLTLIRVLAIFAAIWAASKSVAEEIEGRTALTVLSKPVGRREFILGKFLGITAALTWMFVLLGFWFVVWVAYKPVYDAVESTASDIEWSDCFVAATSVIPVLVLSFMEVIVFVAVSVAISTRFGILANLMICFSIYVLGHLTPQLVQSTQVVQAFEPVVFFGQLVAIVFPVLDHFDAQTAINTDSAVPIVYLLWSLVYTGLYSALAVLLALVLFEDRDLA